MEKLAKNQLYQSNTIASLIFISDSDSLINEYDEQESKKRFGQIDLNKVKDYFSTLNELMDQVSIQHLFER